MNISCACCRCINIPITLDLLLSNFPACGGGGAFWSQCVPWTERKRDLTWPVPVFLVNSLQTQARWEESQAPGPLVSSACPLLGPSSLEVLGPQDTEQTH